MGIIFAAIWFLVWGAAQFANLGDLEGQVLGGWAVIVGLVLLWERLPIRKAP